MWPVPFPKCVCTHLGNGTGHRTAIMAAPLLLTSGLAKYKAVLHNNFYYFVCVCKGMWAGDGLD